MKKINKLLLIALIMCTFTFFACSVAPLYEVSTDVRGYKCTSYTGTDAVCYTPVQVGGYDISAIGSNTYTYNIYIDTMYITPNIEAIRSAAFWYCSNLRKVYISKELSEIELYAFHGCKNIELVYYEGTREEFLNLFEDDEDNINSNKELFNAEIIYGANIKWE